jgi:hypothetical protein
VRRYCRTRRTQPRLTARTRERHAAQLDSSGADRPAPTRANVSISRGRAIKESGIPWAVPITRDASAGAESATERPIIRLYRVLRVRAVRRGSAYSASRLFGAPPAWSAHRQRGRGQPDWIRRSQACGTHRSGSCNSARPSSRSRRRTRSCSHRSGRSPSACSPPTASYSFAAPRLPQGSPRSE